MGKTAVEIAEFLTEVLSEEEKKAVKEIVDGGKFSLSLTLSVRALPIINGIRPPA